MGVDGEHRAPADRDQHILLAAPANLATVLDLIAEHETTAGQTADRLREQITTLTAELARIDSELSDLKVTRTTLRTLAAAEFTADDPTIASAPHQQILEVLATAPTGIRAKDICLALGVDPLPKNVEGTRARLKHMVNRQVLTEDEPGVFTLAPKRNLSNYPLTASIASLRCLLPLPAATLRAAVSGSLYDLIMEKRPDLVLLDQRIWYVPDGVFHLQCVARTSRRRRCQNPLEYGQTGTWSQLRSTRGLISVYDLSILDDDATRRWMNQHCDLHDTPTVVDEVSPEWERFDPVRCAAMITTLDEWVAQRERVIREGVTDRWDYWEMSYL